MNIDNEIIADRKGRNNTVKKNRHIEVNEYISICEALGVPLNTFAGVPEQEKEVG